ncbi:cupredoxin domain-containing protein [Massilia sp. R2A-15]|uniref:cupredoxin domain-containing protein n=1 Tax=Massilia sp. R2A-15 TaxID=3064278 RepID=UPI0027362644|nr:cupredoxin domain-containing protein [Massilia sp. R2A-15]WLI91148.1 cupredoxin domain-containing protein [Massilia sp. R2A-15]
MQGSRRRFLIEVPLTWCAGLMLAGAVHSAPPEEAGRVIKIEARKFRFAPDLIELKVGEAVVLELTALDFVHGFSIPEWRIRTDLAIGQPVRLRLRPDRPGRFTFLCDNFCGSGHEEMNGSIVVAP